MEQIAQEPQRSEIRHSRSQVGRLDTGLAQFKAPTFDNADSLGRTADCIARGQGPDLLDESEEVELVAERETWSEAPW